MRRGILERDFGKLKQIGRSKLQPLQRRGLRHRSLLGKKKHMILSAQVHAKQGNRWYV